MNTENSIAAIEAPTLDLFTKENANGTRSISRANVLAYYKAKGFSGKDLHRKVNDTIHGMQAGFSASVAGMVSERGLQYTSLREKKNGGLTISMDPPKADPKRNQELVSENGALRSELEELRKMIAEMRSSAKSVAETAPEEPAVETAMSAAFEAAGV